MKNLTGSAQARLQARVRRVDTSSGAQEAFERILQKHRAVGGAMSLVRDGRVVRTLTAGVARREDGAPVTPETVFRCASISKMAAAMGALRLCEAGLLTLDGDIGDTLGFRARNPRFPHRPLTLRQLLTHTAGLSDAGTYAAGDGRLEDMLADARNYGPCAPGEQFAYSNFGAGVVGCMMESATGERFEALMERLVFAPLGIGATFAPQWVAARERIANGYRVRRFLPPRLAYDAQRIAARPLAGFDPQRDYQIAPGRMLATSAELARLLALAVSRDGMGVLTPESLNVMRAPQDGMGSVVRAGRGLNVAFLDHIYTPGRLIGHQGVAYGMCAEAWGDPQTGEGVVFQTNGALLSRGGSMMNVGADALALGFALLQKG